MNYLIHATPVHPSLCLQYLILLFTIATVTIFTLLLLLLLFYYHHYKIVATDKPLRASLFPGAAELTTHLLRLINILWLPLCRINNFGFYFPRRMLRSPILVGHQRALRQSKSSRLNWLFVQSYACLSMCQVDSNETFQRRILQSHTVLWVKQCKQTSTWHVINY
jgi:hypothetical protein